MWTRRLAITGLGLAALAAALFAAAYAKQAADFTVHLKVGSGVVLVGAAWFSVEAVRFGYWQRHFLYPSDGASYRPAPRYMAAIILSGARGAARATGRAVRRFGRGFSQRFRRVFSRRFKRTQPP
jgi:hypothetical protein